MLINRMISDRIYRDKVSQVYVKNIPQEYEHKVHRVMLELDVMER